MDVDKGGKCMGIEEGGGTGLDEAEEGDVVQKEHDGSGKESEREDSDGSGSDSEIRVLGVWRNSDTDEDSTGA
eukprot:2427984-Rhodomonas_salina.1